MKKILAQIALFVSLCVAGISTFAGGPLNLAGPAGRTPVTYPNGGQNINMNLDQGNLGSRTKAQADVIFNQAFALWNNVSTSTVTLNRGPDLPVDVTAVNFNTYLSRYSDGLNPVVYDTDGSITDSLFGVGAKNNILGFAGSAFFSSTATYAEGEAVINGFISISDNTLAVVLTHEIGHFIGLDHTQLDNTQGLASSNYALMYPIAFRTLTSLHEDDTAAISALYPTGISAAYGTLTGVFTQVNAAPILGANIWVRETTSGKVYSSVSDFLTEGTGFYRMLLPPGTYTLNAESIQTNFTGGSSVGPYSDNSSSVSFLAPHPIAPVVFQGGTPGPASTFRITAGCAANITFKLDGSGTVNSTTCLNRAPVAQNGSVSTPSNIAVNGIVAVTDADNDPLTYRIVSQGTRGTATMNTSTGAFTYTPLGTSSGSDSFTFAANDGTVDSNIATISVTISNVAPVVATLTANPQTLLDNTTSQLQAVASDSDGPSPLSYQWTILSGGGSLNNVAIANPIYTPANVSVSTSVTLNVAVSDSVATTNRSITLTVNDAGLPLSVSTASLPNATVGVAYSQSLTVTGGAPPYTWSLIAGGLPAGLSLNTVTGVISGTPTAAGTSNFTVRVSDANASTASLILTLIVDLQPLLRTNVALQANGGVATASSTVGSQFSPAGANNGDRRGVNWGAGGGWNDGTLNAFPDWLQVAFNGSKTIDEINVFTVQDSFNNPVEPTQATSFTLYGLTAFDIQYWNGTSWITVSGGSISNNNLVWRKITFPAITTDRIRVLVNNALGSYSRVTEIEAFTATSGGGGNAAPTVDITSPSNGASFVDPANITLSANAIDSDGTIAKVEYFNGSVLIGEAFTSPFSFTWTNVAAGSYSLTAKATDNLGAITTSGAVLVTVNPVGARTNVALQANGGVATASSTVNSQFPPAGANNGDRRGLNWGAGGGWNDGTINAFPDWLQVTFNGSKTIDEINVFTVQDSFNNPVEPTETTSFTLYGLTSFDAQYWDGTSWITVPGGSISNNNLVWRKITFPAVTTDRIRVLVNNAMNSYSRVTEIEAY